jgi:RND family efflux transporter MFP subunit
MPALVNIPAAGDSPENGVVKAISSGGDPATGSYKVIVEWKSDNKNIKSGMTAAVRIPTNDERKSLIIPASAIVPRNRQDYVFLNENAKAQAVQVETGKALGNRLEIISGIKEGDSLIISGLNSIAPGSPINPTSVNREEALQ